MAQLELESGSRSVQAAQPGAAVGYNNADYNQAVALVRSGWFDRKIDTPEKALIMKMYADYLRIPWIVAMTKLPFIGGRPSIPPEMMLALARRDGLLESIEIQNNRETCTVILKRRGEPAYRHVYSMKDAQTFKTKEDGQVISLDQKFNWKSQPGVMLQWRCIAAACRIVFPDVLAGFSGLGGAIGAPLEIMDLPEAVSDLTIEPEADPRDIIRAWIARWKVQESTLTNANILAALGVDRLLDYDWLAPDAIEVADETINFYLTEEHGKAQLAELQPTASEAETARAESLASTGAPPDDE